MNVASLCKHPLATIDAAASLRDAALAMRTHHVGALLVTAESAERGAIAPPRPRPVFLPMGTPGMHA